MVKVSMSIGCCTAQGIKERDGHDCNVDDLYLTEGASGAVKNILQIMIRNEKDAILIPYPQYPLYSAAIALLGGTVVPYYPDENKGWQIDPAHLEDVLAQVLPQSFNAILKYKRLAGFSEGCSGGKDKGRGLYRARPFGFCMKHLLFMYGGEVAILVMSEEAFRSHQHQQLK